MEQNKPRKNVLRSIKYGTTSILLIAVILAIIVAVNIIVSMYDVKVDLTKSSLFSISENSIELINKIPGGKQINIYGLFDPAKNAGDKQKTTLAELAREYQRKSDGKIKVEFVDPTINPTFFNQIGLKEEQQIGLNTAEFLVECNGKFKIISHSDCFTTEYDQDGNQLPDSLNAENAISAAINTITSDSVTKIYFVTGHGESMLDVGYTNLKKLLESNNFTTSNLNILAKGGIPSDANLLVFLGPTNDISDNEKNILNKYLTGGGSALMLFDASDNGKPFNHFSAVLEEYNIRINNDIIRENSSEYRVSGEGSQMFVAFPAVENAIKELDSLYLLVNGSRSLDILNNAKENMSTQSILYSSTTAYSETISGKKSPEGAKTIGAATILNRGLTTTNLLVLGNSTFVSDNLTQGYPTYTVNSNKAFLQYVNWLLGKKTENMVYPKIVENNTLELTEAQAKTIEIIFVIILPILIFLLGVVIWFRRRHK